MPVFRSLPTRLALVAFLAAPAGAAPAQEFLTLKDTVPSIAITGEASLEVVPNIAILSLGVETERPTAIEAANENAKATQAVIAEIRAAGIDSRDMRTLGVTLMPVYDETTDANGRVTKQTLRGYQARNDLSVRVRQIDKAGALARQWIEKGVNQFGGVEFDVDQKEAKYDALRGEAVRDALRKATSFTSGLGIRLGRVLAISPPERGRGPMPMAMAARAAKSDAASVAIPIEPGVQTLRIEVQVAWELAQ
ncbi:SIMPL domain-containing protein [Methylocella silvestris]|uniref:SIMPL domain-containing protein n=1 Tax=Methylocella silvestris TaxID=199596 RepID=A0A2J7THL6_METSI|nr:SIMPL domain-containing protein [Methylocella silvestris]PNG26247.1 SIMPL domain-containing protein [Methylocella silvestris]